MYVDKCVQLANGRDYLNLEVRYFKVPEANVKCHLNTSNTGNFVMIK